MLEAYLDEKNFYGDGGMFSGLFLARKIKNCLTIIELESVQEKKI